MWTKPNYLPKHGIDYVVQHAPPHIDSYTHIHPQTLPPLHSRRRTRSHMTTSNADGAIVSCKLNPPSYSAPARHFSYSIKITMNQLPPSSHFISIHVAKRYASALQCYESIANLRIRCQSCKASSTKKLLVTATVRYVWVLRPIYMYLRR